MRPTRNAKKTSTAFTYHSARASIATLETEFREAKAAALVRTASLGETGFDGKKLAGALKSYVSARARLSAQLRELRLTPHPFIDRCCCCCDDQPGKSYTGLDLSESGFTVFSQQGLSAANQVGVDKSAHGEAGSAGGVGVPTTSSIQFGFVSSFALPGSRNDVTVRSGVTIDPSWLEAQSFSMVGTGVIRVVQRLTIQVGAFTKTTSATRIDGQASMFGEWWGDWSAADSELTLAFDRTGAGDVVRVAEEIDIRAIRAGGTSAASAVAQLSAAFLPVHVDIYWQP